MMRLNTKSKRGEKTQLRGFEISNLRKKLKDKKKNGFWFPSTQQNIILLYLEDDMFRPIDHHQGIVGSRNEINIHYIFKSFFTELNYNNNNNNNIYLTAIGL